MRTTGFQRASEVPSPLGRQDALELLARCASASLACTVNALPTVVPVTVHVSKGGLRVAVPRGTDGHRLAGQIVALGAAVPATPHSEGWWVIARGELRPAGGDGAVLALEVNDLDGRSLPTAPRGGWWRC